MANTGIGMRGWMEAAEGWGLGEALRPRLAGAYLVARGPKAKRRGPRGRPDRGLVAGHGELRRGPRPPARGGSGGVAGPADRPAAARRAAAGVHARAARRRREVVEMPGVPLGPADRPGAAAPAGRPDRRRLVDAVTFTSAPAVSSLLRAAGSEHRRRAGGAAQRRAGRLRGPVTAEPLRRLGVPVRAPGTGPARRAGAHPRRRAAPADPHPARGRAQRSRCAATPR